MTYYISPSYIFSYWIFGWFIIYIISKYIPSLSWVHKYTNPLYAFYIGILENIIQLFMIYKYNFKWLTIMLFIANMILFKILPILFLIREPINFYWNSIFIFSLFFVYLLYLVSCGTNIYKVYTEISNSIINEENKTPFIRLYHFITKHNIFSTI
jgi:hypothetical protein